jgi:RHH-type transcriptional regulator, rel operon repressor / antitoxin RelB
MDWSDIMLAIRLPKELEDRLADMAKKTGRTKTFYAKEAIMNYLEDLEDAYIAEKRLDEFYKSGEKAIPLEEVKKVLGLDN